MASPDKRVDTVALNHEPLKAASPSLPKRPAGYDRGHKARADFLRVDSQLGLTYSGMALGTSDPERKTRTIGFARQAYDTIERFRRHVDLTDEQTAKLNVNVARLKRELQRLGQTF